MKVLKIIEQNIILMFLECEHIHVASSLVPILVLKLKGYKYLGGVLYFFIFCLLTLQSKET